MVSKLTEKQANFIAGLPNVFCDIDHAIRAHAFVQRVAPPTVKFAVKAVRAGVSLGLVEVDESGKVRLSIELQRERDQLTESEGYREVGEYELAQRILVRLSK